MNIFNKKEMVGQKVHTVKGNGLIEEVNYNVNGVSSVYPVLVNINNEMQSFTECGRCLQGNAFPSLKFGHIDESEEFDYGVIPWFADWSDVWQKKYFIQIEVKKGSARIENNISYKALGVTYMSLEEAKRKRDAYNACTNEDKANFDWDAA